MPSALELKPCPFCGDKSEPYSKQVGGVEQWWVQCWGGKGTNGPCVMQLVITNPCDTPEEAAAAWNRRQANGKEE